MKIPLGISSFGLQDCVVSLGQSCYQRNFYPASVVLPTNPFGRILTGDEAYKERTHVGLCWPPEARISAGDPIRRSPLFMVWRALVEARDHLVRWDIGRGVSFSLARILAAHIHSLVASTHGKVTLTDHIAAENPLVPVLAIPDHLDEFGQELLLRELAALGYSETMLVWRPVAAALSWLDKVGAFPTPLGVNDHIHCIYLGPDAFEFTTFRLRVKKHDNQDYVLPVRERPRSAPPFTGLDWAGQAIAEHFQGIDEGAFWQAFIEFPEIWQALAGQEWTSPELPRPWSCNGKWTLWNPKPDLRHRIYNIKTNACFPLRRIVEKSCAISSHYDSQPGTIEGMFADEVRRMGELYPKARLRGMVVCGPLAHKEIPPWLSGGLELLKSRGLDVEGDLSEPQAGRLWLSAKCNDPVAEGAAIYGQRTMNEIPSYLDTMPQISILAQEGGRFMWVPLLKAQEIFGGEEHKDRIEKRFQLDAGRRNLHVYLYKGPVEEAPIENTDTYAPQAQEIPIGRISPCQARLLREVVRRLGSLKAVQGRSFFRAETPQARYGRAFAEAIFGVKQNGENKVKDEPIGEIPWSPLRRAVFDFPSPPESNTTLDIEVRIRPASGLAKIEILPQDALFLRGDRVLLNYSSMRFASSLPKRMRGWPRVEEIATDPEDRVLNSRACWVNAFERTPPTVQDYMQVLDSVRSNVITGKTRTDIAGLILYLGSIDKDGRACSTEGQKIIDKIAQKIDSDYRILCAASHKPIVRKQISKIITRAGWLYCAAPPNLLDGIRRILHDGPLSWGWRAAVEAGGRAFANVEDFRLLFKSVASLARSNRFEDRTFPIHSARSVCRILMFREDGEKGLDRDMAQLFANRAFQRLYKEQKNLKFKSLYFQMLQLLLYLLRYRRSDPLCFDPSIASSILPFEQAKKSMEFAKGTFPRQSKKPYQIQKIIEGFDKYLHYEGTEDVISVLRDLAEEDDGNDNDD